MRTPDWLIEMKDSIWEWLLSIREEHPGMFRFCKTGYTLKPSLKTGLGTSSLALKVCNQIDKIDQVEDEQLEAWVDYIRSFQIKPPSKFAGLFEDPGLLQAINNKGRFRRNAEKQHLEIRRAETRQACAALMAAGYTPEFPIESIPKTENGVHEYLDGLPWSTNPWGAGSHASHLVFLLKLNADAFGWQEYENFLPIILDRLDKLQKTDTGSWYKNSWLKRDPQINMKVNGAMKILTLYDLIKQPFRYPEHLIDLCLDSKDYKDACNQVDLIYVLHECLKWTSHREEEIKNFAENRLSLIQKHKKPDGAFSFFTDKAGKHYYGAQMSYSLPESDIHGTHLLVWSCTLIANILEFQEELGWKLPIT